MRVAITFRLIFLACLAQAGVCNASTTATTQVTINHSNGTVSTQGLLELLPREQIEFVVTETITSCFLYNATAVTEDPAAAGTAQLTATDEVRWTTTHQRGTAKYKIEITRRPNAAAETCSSLDPLEKDISVATLGWEIGLAGAFTIDGLQTPEYFLAPQSGTTPQEYVVTRDRGAESELNTDLAILIHLHNTKWARDWPVEWAPVTFGVGFGDSTRYLFGTSAKFGNAFFLTAGYLVGKVNRLPTGIAEGSITTDANALNSKPQKNDSSWFVGFSYQFLSSGASDRLEALFGNVKTDKPAPGEKN
jgi:hypothetical protein